MRPAPASILVAALAAACSGGSEPVKLAGAPCAVLEPAAFQALGITPEESMRLGTATVRFRFGRAKCEATGSSGGGWDSGEPVCHFSSPSLLHVTTAGGGEFYFDPGVGQPASLLVGAEEARCVLDETSKA